MKNIVILALFGVLVSQQTEVKAIAATIDESTYAEVESDSESSDDVSDYEELQLEEAKAEFGAEMNGFGGYQTYIRDVPARF